MKCHVRSDARERRAAEYPSIEDQLDALWKGGAEAERMKETIQAVKARHPKHNGENVQPTE